MEYDTHKHPYEERIVAFIDILGFSSLIKRAETEPSILDRLLSALHEVRNYTVLGNEMNQPSKGNPVDFFYNMFRMTTFSDCMVLSSKNNLIGLGLITLCSAVICNRLIHQGIFTRGAISRGKLLHTDDVVVGAGLVEAYKLESSAAVYPRVLIADCLINDLELLAKQGGSIDLRRQDFDGLWHIHIFHPKLFELDWVPPNSLFGSLKNQYMAAGRSEIESALELNQDPSIRAKIGWLSRYFNEYAGDFNLPKININKKGALIA